MAKVSFGQTVDAATQPVVEVQTVATQAPTAADLTPGGQAPLPAQAVQKYQPQPVAASSPFDDGGDIDTGDIIIPRLNLVHRVGDLSAHFPPESVVLNGETLIQRPVELVVLGFRPKLYVEKVQGTAPGDFARSPQEVVEKGGTTSYQEAKKLDKPYYQPLATAVILVKRGAQDTDDSAFPLEFEGAQYAVALWSMKGTAYTRAAKKIFTARTTFGHLKKGYHTFSWMLNTAVESFDSGNVAVVPVLSKGVATTSAFQVWAVGLFNAPVKDTTSPTE